MSVRLRALVFLLALCAGDYLLWGWSIADGHDIVSLVAGLTLLPLAAVSVARGLSFLLERSSSVSRAKHTSRRAAVRERSRAASTADSDPPSRRLAA
jgi:hypothetical protein